MNVFRSHRHEVYTEKVNKIALSTDDDKREILEDKVTYLKTNDLLFEEAAVTWSCIYPEMVESAPGATTEAEAGEWGSGVHH